MVKSKRILAFVAVIAIIFAGVTFTVGCKKKTVLVFGDVSIHFLELGNQFVGDSVYIQYGDIDILIDAGSKSTSAPAIRNYLKNHITDEKIEFVIATHAHEDHIGAFTGTRSLLAPTNKDDIAYDIDYIIDFPRTGKTHTQGGHSIYDQYIEKREAAVEHHGATHYTALECYKQTGGAKRIFNLDAKGTVRLEILYNYYYEHDALDDKGNHIENEYSVAVMLHNGSQQYLFTGDLEQQGEDKLVDYYAQKHGGLGKVSLFKAGHHGSNTSSHPKLLAEIRPDYVCICSCAGTTEYTTLVGGQFPTQNFINRLAPYTDAVYVTTLMIHFSHTASEATFESMNGDIKFHVNKKGKITLTFTGHNKKLKDTEWFKNNRTTPDAWKDAA